MSTTAASNTTIGCIMLHQRLFKRSYFDPNISQPLINDSNDSNDCMGVSAPHTSKAPFLYTAEHLFITVVAPGAPVEFLLLLFGHLKQCGSQDLSQTNMNHGITSVSQFLYQLYNNNSLCVINLCRLWVVFTLSHSSSDRDMCFALTCSLHCLAVLHCLAAE